MSHNAKYVDWELDSGSATGNWSDDDVPDYDEVFTEIASSIISGCNVSQCVTKCSCNTSNGWYAGTKANTKHYYNVTTTRKYYNNGANSTVSCYKAKCSTGEYSDSKPSQTGFTFTGSGNCYSVACDTANGYTATKPTSGTYDTVTYTGSLTTYTCYKTKTPKVYFHVKNCKVNTSTSTFTVNTSYVGNINTSYVGAIKTSSVSNNSSTAIASFSQNTTTAESISTSSINTSTMSYYYYYQFDFMLTNSKTNSSQFTSTSVFGTRTSRSPVGYVYVKTKGEASQNQASILETLLNLSASDKGSTTWKTVSRYLGTSPKVVAYSNSNGNSFVGNPYINSDDVEYVLYGTCLKEKACTSGEYIETTPSQTGFRFTAATIGSSSDCYNVACDTGSDYSSTKPTSGTYSTVTYTGASGTTYECYKSNCVNDAKYFEVSLDLSSLSDGDCKIENNKYNRIVPSWRLTDNSEHTTFTAMSGTIESVTSNGKTYTCDDSSSIHVSNIEVDMTKCGTEISSGSATGYDSDYYKFNCNTISGCCQILGGKQLGYPGAQMACTGTNSVSIDTTKLYVSGVTENNSNATVTVCGATLNAENKYKFTLKGAGGCTWENQELTVKVTGSSTTATEIW